MHDARSVKIAVNGNRSGVGVAGWVVGYTTDQSRLRSWLGQFLLLRGFLTSSYAHPLNQLLMRLSTLR